MRAKHRQFGGNPQQEGGDHEKPRRPGAPKPAGMPMMPMRGKGGIADALEHEQMRRRRGKGKA